MMNVPYGNVARRGAMGKPGKQWQGTLRMRQAVLHPLVRRILLQKRRKRKNGRKPQGLGFKSLRSIDSSSAVDLDPAIWNHLPDELIERILDRFPLGSVIQCRRVCKSWNSYILSRLSSPSLPKKTLLVHYPPGGAFLQQPLTVYNACRNGWDRLDMSPLHEDGLSGLYSIVAADRGLLCFADMTWTNFVVFNVLSKQWRTLPPRALVLPQFHGEEVVKCVCVPDYTLVGLVVDEEDGSWKLVLVGLTPQLVPCPRHHPMFALCPVQREGQSRKTLVYDSRLGSWSSGPVLPIDPEIGIWFIPSLMRSVCSEGKLYWIVGWQEPASLGRGVLRFDTKTSKWSCEAFLEGSSCQDLLALEGKALVMDLWTGSGHWEYVGNMLEIKDHGVVQLIQRKLPNVLYDLKRENAMYDRRHRCRCLGHGTSLFVLRQLEVEVVDGRSHFVGSKFQWKVVYYDSSKKADVWLPALGTHLREECPILSWWTLQPSLAALA